MKEDEVIAKIKTYENCGWHIAYDARCARDGFVAYSLWSGEEVDEVIVDSLLEKNVIRCGDVIEGEVFNCTI